MSWDNSIDLLEKFCTWIIPEFKLQLISYDYIPIVIYLLCYRKPSVVCTCTISMIELGFLTKSFGRIKLHKKRSGNIIFLYLRKWSRLRGQFCRTALIIDTFFCTNAVLQNWPLNRDNFLISCLSISIMSNVQGMSCFEMYYPLMSYGMTS